jgi:hypothetical protein
MELKFEELDNQTNTETQDTQTNEVNYVNYWSNANSVTTSQKKPKVSYDDILSSLNMVVNNGVLQFAKPTEKQGNQGNQGNQGKKSQQKKTVTINEQHKQQHHQNHQHQQNNYITNKYFKDYKEQSQGVEEPEIPLTKEEYRQMLIQDYINRQQAQRRISQIKSRRLLFDTQHINIAPTQMPRDMNKLFKPFKR